MASAFCTGDFTKKSRLASRDSSATSQSCSSFVGSLWIGKAVNNCLWSSKHKTLTCRSLERDVWPFKTGRGCPNGSVEPSPAREGLDTASFQGIWSSGCQHVLVETECATGAFPCIREAPNFSATGPMQAKHLIELFVQVVAFPFAVLQSVPPFERVLAFNVPSRALRNGPIKRPTDKTQHATS